MRHTRAILSSAAIVCGLTISTPATAQVVRVADSSSTIPGGSGTFGGFGTPSVSGSTVHFFGSNTFRYGVFTGTTSGGTLARIAEEGVTAAPNSGGGSFNLLRFSPAESVSGTTAVFPGQFGGGTSGIGMGVYAEPAGGGAIVRVADTSFTIPGTSMTFTSFSSTAVSGSAVAFFGANGSRSGLYSGTTAGGALARIVDSETIVPGQAFTFSQNIGAPALSGSVVAYSGAGFTGSYLGVFTSDLVGNGLTAVADINTAIPGGTGTFSRFGDAAVSGSRVAFMGGNTTSDGLTNANDGIYTAPTTGGPVAVVANRSTAIPGGSGNFQTFANRQSPDPWWRFTPKGRGRERVRASSPSIQTAAAWSD